MEEYDLIRCIDKGLDLFGSSVKNAIFWKIATSQKSHASEVVSDPATLASIIKETFSDNAAVIERSIIEEIRNAFDLPYRETSSLVLAFSAARKKVIGTG